MIMEWVANTSQGGSCLQCSNEMHQTDFQYQLEEIYKDIIKQTI
jgi:hypothetical protein